MTIYEINSSILGNVQNQYEWPSVLWVPSRTWSLCSISHWSAFNRSGLAFFGCNILARAMVRSGCGAFSIIASVSLSKDRCRDSWSCRFISCRSLILFCIPFTKTFVLMIALNVETVSKIRRSFTAGIIVRLIIRLQAKKMPLYDACFVRIFARAILQET